MPTPLAIMIGIHYYTSPEPYAKDDAVHANSSATFEVTNDFVRRGLLISLAEPGKYGSMYKATDALRVWVEALCTVPLPIQAWVIPKENGSTC